MGTIRYGLIGCGEHALQSHVLPGEKIPELELVALCDPNEESTWQMCHTLGRDIEVHTQNDLMRRSDIDAVVIASPDRFHLSTLSQAIHMRKHVLCEKPMATTREEMLQLRTVLEIARSDRLIVTSCHPRRFDPPYLMLKNVLSDLIGQLGKILGIKLDFSYHRPGEHKADLHQGLLIDHVNHEHDLITFLLGPTNTWMRRLADSHTHYEAFGMRSDGVSLHFTGTRKLEARIYPEYVAIRFERGHVLLETASGTLTIYDHESQQMSKLSLASTDYSARFLGIMQNFVDSIRGTTNNYLTHNDLINNSEIGVALTETGTWAPNLL